MLGENVKKFTFKNCGSVFSTYFYDVRNIATAVSITERKGSALLDEYSQNAMDLVTEQLRHLFKERMKIWGITRTVR